MRITKENVDKFINTNDWDDKDTMDCSRMYITHIDYIPDHIKYLHCYDNKLISLPKLPDSLIRLYCFCNELTSLPKLPENLLSLYCDNNQLTELPILPENLEHLNCSFNNIPYKVSLGNIKEHNKLIKRKEIISNICV
tara:strand:- start:1126 stop:1539 length:414 start_codon:yes stop_codon:yes gene_type:complete